MAATAYNIGALIATMGLDTTQYQAGMASVKTSAAAASAATRKASISMTASMNAAAMQMQAIGKKMQRYLTLPILAVGVASTKVFADFEASMAKIVGLVGVAKSQVDAWIPSVLALGPATGQGPEKLADALFFITSAGIRGAEAMEVLEMAAKASTAGLGEAKVVADLVTSAMNAYGKENLNAAMATDVLTAAVREGKAEASELAGAMGMVLPIASEYGVTFNQVGAAFAAMTRTGTNARVAATQLKAILSAMASPALNAEDAMEKYGTSSARFRKIVEEEGLIQALTHLKTAVNGNKTAMAEIFPNIRALMGVLDLLGKNMEDNVAIFKALEDPTGALDAAFLSATNTIRFKFQKAFATLKTHSIAYGSALSEVVIPAIEKVTTLIAKSTEKWTALSDQQRQNRVRIVALTAAVGPLLGIMGKLTKFIATNPYLALAAAIALIAIAAVKWTKANREVFDGLSGIEGANKALSKQYITQSDNIRSLVRLIENENLSNEFRLQAIEDLKKAMPEYNGHLTDEGELIEHNTEAIEDYLVALKEKIRLQVYEEEYTRLLKRQFELQRKIGDATLKSVGGAGAILAIANLARLNKQYDKNQEAITEMDQAASKLNLTLGSTPVVPGEDGGTTPGSTITPSGLPLLKEVVEWTNSAGEHMGMYYDLVDANQQQMEDFTKESLDRIDEYTIFSMKRRMAAEDQELNARIQRSQSYVKLMQEAVYTIGSIIGGQEGAMKSFVSSTLRGIGQIIDALLAQAVAGYIATRAAIPGGLIAAAVGIPLLLSLWEAKVPSFAEGGIAYGPTVGMMGEYPGARSNPEVIAPLDKLQALLHPGGGGSIKQIKLVLEGRDAVALVDVERLIQNTY